MDDQEVMVEDQDDMVEDPELVIDDSVATAEEPEFSSEAQDAMVEDPEVLSEDQEVLPEDPEVTQEFAAEDQDVVQEVMMDDQEVMTETQEVLVDDQEIITEVQEPIRLVEQIPEASVPKKPIREFLAHNKPIAIISALALLGLLGAAAYGLTRPEPAPEPEVVKEEAPAPVEKKEIEDFDVHTIGDIGQLTVVSPANYVVFDKDGTALEDFTIDPGGTVTLKGKSFEAGEKTLYQIENPVLSDGSIFTLPQAKQFSLEETATGSKEATMTVEVELTKVEVADMTQQQLYHAADKIREAGNEELAKTLVARIDTAPLGESDDGSAKPAGWDTSDLNPRRGMKWQAAVIEEVKTVTKPAWDENVSSGGEIVITSFRCTCGAGPFATEAEWNAHQIANMTIEQRYDANGNAYFTANANGHGIVPQGYAVGQTNEVVHHAEESTVEKKVTSPAGWYPR